MKNKEPNQPKKFLPHTTEHIIEEFEFTKDFPFNGSQYSAVGSITVHYSDNLSDREGDSAEVCIESFTIDNLVLSDGDHVMTGDALPVGADAFYRTEFMNNFDDVESSILDELYEHGLDDSYNEDDYNEDDD